MSSAKLAYLTLLADVQRHLLQEYQAKQWIPAAPENFMYFKNQAAHSTTPKLIAVAPPTPTFQRKPLPPKLQTSTLAPPPPANENKQEDLPTKATFNQEPLGKAAVADLTEIRKLVAENYPKWEIVEPPPFQEKQHCVLVLATQQDALLNSIGQAIQNQLAPVRVLDPSAQDTLQQLLGKGSLRLILVDEMALRAHPPLLSLYRPNLGLLGSAPVLVLTDSAQLAQDPQRKRIVWNQIKEKLT